MRIVIPLHQNCSYIIDFDGHFALHSTAAAVRQHMTPHHDHIVQAVRVVDGCDNFAVMTSGHILIAKGGQSQLISYNGTSF